MPAAATPVGLTVAVFVAGSLGSLAASAVLVRRLERIGARLGLAEAALGLLAALAANTPEITSAVTALLRGERQIGAGVVLGSNVFNIAALLGLGAIVARHIPLHRRVVAFAGVPALAISLVALGTTAPVFPPGAGLALGLVVFVPYAAVSAWPALRHHLRLPAPLLAWTERAVAEEEAELAVAIHPRPATGSDVRMAVVALVVVLGASVAMERSASSIGAHYRLPPAVVGAVVLAAVTSLPNAVAALYLASRGRAVAVLSEALNSNNLNVVLGLLVPAAAVGLGRQGTPGTAAALAYVLMTALALAMAATGGGLRRIQGVALVAGYVGFLVVITAVA